MEQSKHIKPRRRVKSSAQRQSLVDTNRVDRISSLPDSLVLDILSRLKYKQQVQTSLLSKRWRYMWTFTSCLDFDTVYTGDMDKKIAIIDRCLTLHQRTKVRTLRLVIMYEDKYRLTIDSLIHFTIQTNVEVLVLDLTFEDLLDEDFEYDEHPDYVMYKLPDMLFECGSSLTTLALYYCHLDLPTTINLRSLKVLSLYYIDLPWDAIEHLTLGCPILEDLKLKGCNRFDNLNIMIKNEHVKILKIDDFLVDLDDCGTMTLYAPNVLLLVFISVLPRTQYHLNNLQSVTCADLSTVTDLHIHDNNALAEVLHGLNHVKKLKLSSSCIQQLSLRKIQGLDPIFVQATKINLSVGFTKWELPGIAYLLQSAHKLENLTISIDASIRLEIEDGVLGENDFDGKRYWESQEPAILTLVLQNIKRIKIKGFLHCRRDGHRRFTNQPDLSGEFVAFMLMNAKTLEQMVIRTMKFPHGRSPNYTARKIVTRLLKLLPKASPNAELLVT